MINVDADKSITDRAVNERGCNGGVDPAREGTKHAIRGANLRGDCGDCIFGNAPRCPVGWGLGNVVHKVAQQALPARGVHHLGMELDPPEISCHVGKCSKRSGVGVGNRREASWCLGD